MPSDQRFKLANQSFGQIPKDLVNPSGDLDLKKIQQELGITNSEQFAVMLVSLYLTDMNINFDVNRRLLALVLEARSGLKPLPLELKSDKESAWLAADKYCMECSGNDYYEFAPGRFVLQCMNNNRMERYRDCLKYRENIEIADQQLSDGKLHLNVYKEFEELKNAYFPSDE